MSIGAKTRTDRTINRGGGADGGSQLWGEEPDLPLQLMMELNLKP